MHPILQHLECDDAGGIVSESVEELTELFHVRLAVRIKSFRRRAASRRLLVLQHRVHHGGVIILGTLHSLAPWRSRC